MACLAHDEWPSDDEEFEKALKERIYHLDAPLMATAQAASPVAVAALAETPLPDVSESVSKLPPLGPSPQLPGEKLCDATFQGRYAGMNAPHRPEARLRLLVLYGTGGFQMSMSSWFNASPRPPDWLEVRLLELPGHGFREAEPLPFDEDEMALASLEWPPRSVAELRLCRDVLVRQLVDECGPLLGPRTALYGFSSGAMLMFEVAVRLKPTRPATLALTSLIPLSKGLP